MSEEKRPKNDENDFEDLTNPSGGTPRFLWILRYIGIFLVVSSSVFLFNKDKPPFFSMGEFHLQNGPLGHLILGLGMLCFGFYFLHRIYQLIKSR